LTLIDSLLTHKQALAVVGSGSVFDPAKEGGAAVSRWVPESASLEWGG